jgi:hypothetical protein
METQNNTAAKTRTWSRGDKVVCNGNREAIVLDAYRSPGMYEVRLWQGFRHVGDVCVDGSELEAR